MGENRTGRRAGEARTARGERVVVRDGRSNAAAPADQEIALPAITAVMIEAAARAIRDVFGNRSGRGKPFDKLPPRIQQDYRDEARAALCAAFGLPYEASPPDPNSISARAVAAMHGGRR